MRTLTVLGVIFLAGFIISSAVSAQNIQVPKIEKWQLFDRWEWRIGNGLVGFFDIGIHKLYKAPGQANTFGATTSFAGSDEIILKAWWISKSEDPNDTEEISIAVKTETGEWVIYKADLRALTFVSDIQDGKMVSLGIFLSANENRVIRVIKFQPPLSPLSEK